MHWAKSAVLPSHPLLRNLVLVALVAKAELVLGVVMLGQVVEDGGALEHGKAAPVMVDDGGDASVGVDGGEPGLLLGVFHDVYCLVGHFGESGGVEGLQFRDEDAGFEPVGGVQRQDLDAGGGDETCWFGHFGRFLGSGGGGAAVETMGRRAAWSD